VETLNKSECCLYDHVCSSGRLMDQVSGEIRDGTPSHINSVQMHCPRL